MATGDPCDKWTRQAIRIADRISIGYLMHRIRAPHRYVLHARMLQVQLTIDDAIIGQDR